MNKRRQFTEEFKQEAAAQVIERRDRERTHTLNVQLQEGVTAAEVNRVLIPWLDEVSGEWPAGYKFEVGGETEDSEKATASIAAKLPLGLMVIVMLLVIQFNSIRRPIIILATIPPRLDWGNLWLDCG